MNNKGIKKKSKTITLHPSVITAVEEIMEKEHRNFSDVVGRLIEKQLGLM